MLIRNTILHEKGIKAYSTGVNEEWEGENIAEETRTVLSEMRIDPEGRKCQHIDKALMEWADIVLTMEIKHKHYNYIINLFPDDHSKVFN
jgi:protein-tyrosine-phosphatase